jgi:hypothetical protein
MGPNPLWLLEDLSGHLHLQPGMRVLDLGSGMGGTSAQAWAERAGVELMVFGSTTARSVPDGFPVERAQRQLADFIQMCADLTEPRQLQIALEPQNYTDTKWLHTVPEALLGSSTHEEGPTTTLVTTARTHPSADIALPARGAGRHLVADASPPLSARTHSGVRW